MRAIGFHGVSPGGNLEVGTAPRDLAAEQVAVPSQPTNQDDYRCEVSAALYNCTRLKAKSSERSKMEYFTITSRSAVTLKRPRYWPCLSRPQPPHKEEGERWPWPGWHRNKVRAPKAVGAPCLKAQTSWCLLAFLVRKTLWRGSQIATHCIGRGGPRDSAR